MQLKDLKSKKKRLRKTRRGRGTSSGKGCKSGRGDKGQKSRSGGAKRSSFEGGQIPFYRRIPKVRGKSYKSPNQSYYGINVGTIDKNFKASEVVNVRSLQQKGLISRKTWYVKILSGGSIKKKLVFKGLKFSKEALKKAEKAGSAVFREGKKVLKAKAHKDLKNVKDTKAKISKKVKTKK